MIFYKFSNLSISTASYIWLNAVLTNSSTLEISVSDLSILSILLSAPFLAKPSASNADNASSLIVLSTLSNNKSAVGRPFATLSLRSIIILWAVLAPIPFTLCIAFTSAVVIWFIISIGE